MLSSSASSALTNLIRNSMGQTPCHGIAAPPAVTVLICYPCCRYILLPILPVRTTPDPFPEGKGSSKSSAGVLSPSPPSQFWEGGTEAEIEPLWPQIGC